MKLQKDEPIFIDNKLPDMKFLLSLKDHCPYAIEIVPKEKINLAQIMKMNFELQDLSIKKFKKSGGISKEDIKNFVVSTYENSGNELIVFFGKKGHTLGDSIPVFFRGGVRLKTILKSFALDPKRTEKEYIKLEKELFLEQNKNTQIRKTNKL